MGTLAVRPIREIIYLRPEQIITEDKYNVRSFGDGEDSEAIEDLAASIEKDGQLDAGIVNAVPNSKPEPDGTKGEYYTLISGNRRRRAIALLNQKYSSSGKPLLEMRVEVDRSGGEPLRKAIVSNLHRKDFSPMDLATLIKRIITENGWESPAFKRDSKVAEYLNISRATVIQHQKFLSVDGDLQKRLHSGQISAQSALDLIGVAPDKRDEVLGRASQIQAATDAGKKNQPKDSTVPQIPVPPTTVSSVLTGDALDSNKDAKVTKQSRIERPAVVKAIRETEQTVIPRTRKEIVEFFSQLDGPAYGFVDSGVRVFVQGFMKWATGNLSDKSLLGKFDAMTEKSFQGTKEAQAKSDKAEAAKSMPASKTPPKAPKAPKVVKGPVTKKTKPKKKAPKAPKAVSVSGTWYSGTPKPKSAKKSAEVSA